mgnify:CR=1 FL=1
MSAENTNILRKPDWLKIKLPKGTSFVGIKNIVHGKNLNTICQSGNCPNIGECWGAGTATFMILGNICTRSCKFCSVPSGRPEKPNLSEPANIAKSVLEMKLKHCVLTSVDRDDLSDGGASLWAETIRSIRAINPDCTIEALVPDFLNKKEALDIIVNAHPEIVSHNLETVKRLTPNVRSVATYDRSLDVLQYFGKAGLLTKSGIMVGIGETDEEVFQTMDDLLNVGCKIITIGQYLQPTKNNIPVVRYVHPDVFANYKETGLSKGFDVVESAPLVRSSYHAEKHLFVKN